MSAPSPKVCMGRDARRASSAIEVAVNLLVIFCMSNSFVNGAFARVKRPTSAEAVETTIIKSCILGGKSFSRCIEQYGGSRFEPNEEHTSGNFWNKKEFGD